MPGALNYIHRAAGDTELYVANHILMLWIAMHFSREWKRPNCGDRTAAMSSVPRCLRKGHCTTIRWRSSRADRVRVFRKSEAPLDPVAL